LSERWPLNIPFIIDKAGLNLKGISIRNVENKPDNFFVMISKLKERGFNVMFYLVSDVSGEKTCVFMCVEVPEPRDDYSSIAEELRKVVGAQEVTWISYPVPGFVYQPFFPITCFGQRGVFFSGQLLKGLFKGMREKVGRPVTRIALFHAGRSAGLLRAEEAKRERPDLSPKDLVTRFLLSGYALGQYIAEIVGWEEGERALIRVRESWESRHIGKGFKKPQCSFMRGFLEGFFTGTFGKEFSSVERRCECMGDPYCEFELKAKQT